MQLIVSCNHVASFTVEKWNQFSFTINTWFLFDSSDLQNKFEKFSKTKILKPQIEFIAIESVKERELFHAYQTNNMALLLNFFIIDCDIQEEENQTT